MLTFYADFACPYCYLENETLLRLGEGHRVRFRPVSLLPDSAVPWDPKDELISNILETGWESFLARAGDIEVSRPASIPNTRLASRAIAEALECDPEKAPILRTALFRAVWRDGRDIGFLEEVLAIWHEVGLPPREAFSRAARRDATVWQTEWNNEPFGPRVPVITNEEGQRLLGLPTEEALLSFLDDQDAGGHVPDVCAS